MFQVTFRQYFNHYGLLYCYIVVALRDVGLATSICDDELKKQKNLNALAVSKKYYILHTQVFAGQNGIAY
jgi:hypothetical protein